MLLSPAVFGRRGFCLVGRRLTRQYQGAYANLPHVTNTWHFELYDQYGRLIASREGQSVEQVWFAAIDCTGSERVKFAAPPDASGGEIDRGSAFNAAGHSRPQHPRGVVDRNGTRGWARKRSPLRLET